MTAARKRKPVEANDGSYGGMVLGAWDQQRACRVCGCTELKACPGGCCWAAEDLCSACLQGKAPRDPRTDPTYRDSVTVAGETREVEGVFGEKVIYSWPGKIAVRTIYLPAWRAWAAQASAWKTAEAEASHEA